MENSVNQFGLSVAIICTIILAIGLSMFFYGEKGLLISAGVILTCMGVMSILIGLGVIILE